MHAIINSLYDEHIILVGATVSLGALLNDNDNDNDNIYSKL